MIIHSSDSRGLADHGWLKSRHTFSFAEYYDPDRMGFGALRVINDDLVAPGMGFGTHPHRDMEIISIPLEGALSHRDSEGNASIIRKGEVQIMSAGTGILHSEFNASNAEAVKFLQIWVLPEKRGISPRYEQKNFSDNDKKNKFLTVVSPKKEDGGVWINQDAYFSLAEIEKGKEISYERKSPSNGFYLFILSGAIKVGGQVFKTRDGIGLKDTNSVLLKAEENTELLVMEVPV